MVLLQYSVVEPSDYISDMSNGVSVETLTEREESKMSRRVDSQDYNGFKNNFYKNGTFKFQRLGQAFIGTFFPLESIDGLNIIDRDPSLFYEEDDNLAEMMIFERYIK